METKSSFADSARSLDFGGLAWELAAEQFCQPRFRPSFVVCFVRGFGHDFDLRRLIVQRVRNIYNLPQTERGHRMLETRPRTGECFSDKRI
jgi:hypothetical protein